MFVTNRREKKNCYLKKGNFLTGSHIPTKRKGSGLERFLIRESTLKIE